MSTLRARIGTAALLGFVCGAGLVACTRTDPPTPAPTPAPAPVVAPASEPTPEPAPGVAPTSEPTPVAEAPAGPIIILDEEMLLIQDVPKGTTLPHVGGGGTGDADGTVRCQPLDGGVDPRSFFGASGRPGGDVPLPARDPRAAEDGFVPVSGDGVASTFAVDVDTASYAFVRQALLRGYWPGAGAVRVEELINYFPYDDAPPPADARAPLAARAEVAQAPWAPERRLVRVSLRARDVVTRPPSNLVFLIDVSGSMREPARLPLVKRALGLLVRQLGENDRVALVVYAGASGLVLPSTSCDDPRPVLAAIERLEAGGSTNGGAGIELAYRTAAANFVPGGTNRVLLLTDGDWNVGVTSRPALDALIERHARSGVLLTVLGFGMRGRTDATMERLADRGDGMYAFVDGEREAKKVLVQQVMGTLVTVARDVKVQVTWDPTRVARWRLVGYENRRLKNHEFRDDRKDAGEVGAGHGVTALYEVEPRNDDDLEHGPLGTLRVRWKAPDATRDDPAHELAVPVVDPDRPFAAASDDLRFTTAVAALGLTLRGQAPGGTRLATVRGWAEGSLGPDPHGLRRELIDLVRQAEKQEPPPRVEVASEASERASSASDAQVEVTCRMLPPEGPLAWLHRHQAEDGRWDADGWTARCGDEPCPADPGVVDGSRDVGLTATVLRAIVENGHTHRFGSWKQAVHQGLRWLRSRQGHDGVFRGEVDHPRALDDHALATTTLCELYARSRDFTLKPACEEALVACVRLQDADGGWSSGDPGPAGVARTARYLLALETARVANLDVPESAWSRGVEWLAARTRPRDLARPGHHPARCAAALALAARFAWGERSSTEGMGEAARALGERVAADGPCAWSSLTTAAFLLGGPTWSAWQEEMLSTVLPGERGAGCADGSWDAAPSCGVGGRVEATALACLALEVHGRAERLEAVGGPR